MSYDLLSNYTVWVKKITPYDFCQFLPNGWEFFIVILRIYYEFKYTIDCQILSNYLQILQCYAALSATTPRILSLSLLQNINFWLLTSYRISIHLTIMCGVPCFRHFTKFIQSQKPFQCWKVFCSRSGMACRRQPSTKLSTTFVNVWTHALWPIADILNIRCEVCADERVAIADELSN